MTPPPSNSPSNRSLQEVHRSVKIPAGRLWWRLFAFAGPAYLVSVGYMDPGNWATDLEGGARFGYRLIWVLLMSNAMAVLLQTLSARLGLVTGRDLAQACHDAYPRFVNYVLFVLCEIAIAACDLAEVLGSAIGLNLLFGIPILWAVLITAGDVLLLLAMGGMGMRKIEAFILVLISTIGLCFIIEIFLCKPSLTGIASGFVPTYLTGKELYIAIGILGATVMPHNLYLHSSLVQSRDVTRSREAVSEACRYNLIDSVVEVAAAAGKQRKQFRVIAAALEVKPSDSSILAEAVALAQSHAAKLILLHVVEGAGGPWHGEQTGDLEGREDESYLRELADQVRRDPSSQGLAGVDYSLGYGDVPNELVALCGQHSVDLLILGGHGHRGIWDWFFGQTIPRVRHGLTVPIIAIPK